MAHHDHRQARSFTLIEIVLVVALLVLISAMAIPNFLDELRREELPTSANQLRSLVTLVRAHAAFDSKRYRIRFPREDERDALGGRRQPIIEREDDPILRPEEYVEVTAPWAVGKTLLGRVRCAEVRLGRPTVHDIRRRRESASQGIPEAIGVQEKRERFEYERPPVHIDPDGGSDWVMFVLTEASEEVALNEVHREPTIEVILDGMTGLCWLQRPLYEEELDLFEEKNWPVVLRRDFLGPRMLTEQDVLELRDLPVESRGTAKTPEQAKGRS